MTLERTNQQSGGSSTVPCPCGCAPCDTLCCGLECLEQPRFYCGQLLTDQDLTGLVDWTRGKLGRKRFLQGWGVVCGLDVRCHPEQAGQVMVSPGYAVDCCGNDIVVCQPTPYDLSGLCLESSQDCEELIRAKRDTKQEPTAIDLFLGYAEEGTAPRVAFGRTECRDVERCEPSRVKESFELRACANPLDSNPEDQAAMRWVRLYSEWMKPVLKLVDELQGRDVGEAKKLLLDWLNRNPPHSFCFLRDWVCGLTDASLKEEWNKLRFWLALDMSLAYLRCDCHECADEPGVRLARILLRPVEDRGGWRCAIKAIDGYPPYRRPIRRDCWPAPLGKINLGQLIWRRYEDACAMLRAMGIHPIYKQEISLEELDPVSWISRPGRTTPWEMAGPGLVPRPTDSAPLFVGCNQGVVLRTLGSDEWTPNGLSVHPWGERVVGFLVTDNAEKHIVEGAGSKPPTTSKPPSKKAAPPKKQG